MNWNHTKYQLLNNLREPSTIFWTMLYPILMAMMFYTAFQGFLTPEPIEIKVGVQSNTPAVLVLGGIDILKASPLTAKAAEDAMERGELTGYVDKDFNVTVTKSGVKETILVSVVSQIRQMQALGVPFQNFDFSARYAQATQARANPFLIHFYSLIGMVSLYSIFMGGEFARIIQADQSLEALRLNVVPLRKTDFLSGSLFIGILVNLCSNILLLGFMNYVLKLGVITDFARSLSLLLTANLVGISLGLFIGGFSRLSQGAKNGLFIGSTLFLAFLSGMMNSDTKIYFEDRFPNLSQFNPVAIVTTEMYRINYLSNSSGYIRALLILSSLAAVLLGASWLFLRRKTYDSL